MASKRIKKMSACPDEEVLASFVRGELDPEQTPLIRGHVDECLMCSSAVREFSAAVALIERVKPEPPARDLTEEIMTMIARSEPQSVAIQEAVPSQENVAPAAIPEPAIEQPEPELIPEPAAVEPAPIISAESAEKPEDEIPQPAVEPGIEAPAANAAPEPVVEGAEQPVRPMSGPEVRNISFAAILFRLAAAVAVAAGIVYACLHIAGTRQEPVVAAKTPATVQDTDMRSVGLRWLAQAQDQSGKWDPGRWGGRQEYTIGLTGMAILSLAGSDNPQNQASIKKAVAYLLSMQDRSGRFGGEIDGMMYNHGIATAALLEAYRHSRNTQTEAAIKSALAFIRERQLKNGGWGYSGRTGDAANTSISTWPLQSLLVAAELKLDNNQDSLSRGVRWLVSVMDDKGQFGYEQQNKAPQGSDSLTAMGAWCVLRAAKNGVAIDKQVLKRIERSVAASADSAEVDYYRTYFRICALKEVDSTKFAESLLRLQKSVIATRQTTGPETGSWDPKDQWGLIGGRIYSTAMAAMALEAAPL